MGDWKLKSISKLRDRASIEKQALLLISNTIGHCSGSNVKGQITVF